MLLVIYDLPGLPEYSDVIPCQFLFIKFYIVFNLSKAEFSIVVDDYPI
jgi:hypothetical protein